MSTRPAALLGAALAIVLLLASCVSGLDSSRRTALPTVLGDVGSRPEIRFPASAPPREFTTEVVAPGDGGAVEPGGLVLVHYLAQVWDGAELDSSYDGGTPLVASLPGLPPGWGEALSGLRVGARVLLSVPPEVGYSAPGDAARHAESPDETVVLVVDVVGAYGKTAGGQPDAWPNPVAAGTVAPRVTGALGGPASVTVPPGAAPPTEVVTTVLARGTGPSVSPGPVIAQYAAVDWNGANAGNSWESGAPEQFLVSPADRAFAGLAGVPLGSRVLVQLPGDAGGSPAVAIVMDLVGQP